MRFLANVLFWAVSSAIWCGCNSTRSGETKVTQESPQTHNRSDDWFALQQRFSDLRSRGWDFVDLSSDSNTALLINYDSVAEICRNGLNIIFYTATNTLRQPADFNGYMLYFENDQATLTVQLKPDSCAGRDSRSNVYAYRARIMDSDLNTTEYTGCGVFLVDPSVNDIWALKSWKHPDTFTGNLRQARIEFNLGTQRLFGYDGCNEFQGYIRPLGSKMKIYALEWSTDNQACSGDSTGRKFFDALNFKMFDVERAGLMLTLTNERDTIVLKKID